MQITYQARLAPQPSPLSQPVSSAPQTGKAAALAPQDVLTPSDLSQENADGEAASVTHLAALGSSFGAPPPPAQTEKVGAAGAAVRTSAEPARRPAQAAATGAPGAVSALSTAPTRVVGGVGGSEAGSTSGRFAPPHQGRDTFRASAELSESAPEAAEGSVLAQPAAAEPGLPDFQPRLNGGDREHTLSQQLWFSGVEHLAERQSQALRENRSASLPLTA